MIHHVIPEHVCGITEAVFTILLVSVLIMFLRGAFKK